MISAGIIGWPVAHSKSPLIHRFWLAKLGIDGDYSRFAVAPTDLGEAIRALPKLGLAGVNVTVPHKVAVMAHMDRLSEAASEVGAVNCVTVSKAGIIGDNVDVVGVRASILGIENGTVCLIGNGGAARAALWVLSRGNRRTVRILCRDTVKAAALLSEFRLFGECYAFDNVNAAFAGTKLIINATLLGMQGEPRMPAGVLAALDDASPDAAVFDMVYAPLKTPLLVRARTLGFGHIDGLHMLVAQAAAAFALFYGQPAPREHDAELRALLTA